MRLDPQIDPQHRHKGHLKLWLAGSVLAAILLLLFVPPLVSISSYKNRITEVMSDALRRPVRLSSVELRLLPRPAFVVTDLTVEENPEFGAEPVLHANTVTASIWLLPLWRGKLKISRVSVDEASVNLVQIPGGHWNLDSLFRTTAAQPGLAGGPAMPLPYIEATNSRINMKNGAEKLPFSLVGADLSFWQEESGDWRVRLRGQPARTDVSLDLPDTGLVRMEATLGRAPQLRQMPFRIDVDWRNGQLGQLTRLVLGTDQGWRGDLTGEIHVQGTADSAQAKTRLRASGVHRAEFTPSSPIDFDATCSFVVHYSNFGAQDLTCESPIGTGKARLSGDMPSAGQPTRLALELDRIPAQAGLDALRTLRINLDQGLEASGTVSGKMSYDSSVEAVGTPERPVNRVRRSTAALAQPRNRLTGSFTVAGLQISGKGLSKPVPITRMTIEPAPAQLRRTAEISTTVVAPAGGALPLTIAARLGPSGYQMEVRGSASLERMKELARIAGIPQAAALDQLAGEPATLDLSGEGPWLPVTLGSFSAGTGSRNPVLSSIAQATASEAADKLSGTVTLHNANWKPDFLANAVIITSAVLHLEDGEARWDPIAFSYGPVKGTATLEPQLTCDPPPCAPRFTLNFDKLDAGALQAAILGAHEEGTLLSTLLDRLRPSAGPSWPALEGTVHAGSFVLAPVTLTNASASIRILPTGAEIKSLDAECLGGHVRASGSLTASGKPAYTLQGKFIDLDAGQVGRLLGMEWSGGGLNGAAEAELSGYTDKDLAASAQGTLHFEWRHGAVESAEDEMPPALSRFDQWTADAAIAKGAITLRQNQVQRGSKKSPVQASVAFGDPPTVIFGPQQEARSLKR